MLKTWEIYYSIQGPAATSANQGVTTVVQATSYVQAQAIVEGMFNGTAHIYSVIEKR